MGNFKIACTSLSRSSAFLLAPSWTNLIDGNIALAARILAPISAPALICPSTANIAPQPMITIVVKGKPS